MGTIDCGLMRVAVCLLSLGLANAGHAAEQPDESKPAPSAGQDYRALLQQAGELAKAKQDPEAEKAYQAAVDAAQRKYGANKPEVAEALLTKSVRLLETGAGTDTPNLAISLINLAAVYEATGRPAEADQLRARAEAIAAKVYGDRRPPWNQFPRLPVWSRDA
jgi:hypothetical protein